MGFLKVSLFTTITFTLVLLLLSFQVQGSQSGGTSQAQNLVLGNLLRSSKLVSRRLLVISIPEGPSTEDHIVDPQASTYSYVRISDPKPSSRFGVQRLVPTGPDPAESPDPLSPPVEY